MNKLISLYVNAQSRLQSIAKNEKGATMVEYAMMVALIAVVCITAVELIGTNTNTTFGSVAAAI